MNYLLGFALLAIAQHYATGEIDHQNVIKQGLQNLNISSELQNELTSKLSKTEDLLKEKCRKNSGGEEAYEAAKQAVLDSQSCLSKFADLTDIHTEIEEKKKTGDLDLVFGKYCKRKSDVLTCATNLKKAFMPCLETEERDAANTFINITNSLLDFACFRDGDRIALFIAEGGPECIKGSVTNLKTCAENSLDLKLNETPTEIPNFDSLPNLAITPERCEKLGKLQDCVVKELEKCSETTPANIVEALFNFIKRRTPCGQQNKG